MHWSIVIEGFSGLNKRNFVDKNGIKKLSTIGEILESFEHFLTKYRQKGEKLDFYDLLKGKKYIDSFPTAFTYTQSADESRLGYKWQLELMCYSEVDAPPIKIEGYEKFFADLTASVDSYTSQVEDLNILIDSVSDFVNRPVRELLNSTSRALNSTLNIVKSTRGGIQATRSTILRAIETVYEAVNTAQNLVAETKALFSEDFNNIVPFARSELKNGNADVQATFKSLGLTDLKSALEIEEAMYRLNILAGTFGVYNTQSKNDLKTLVSGGSFLDTENSLSTLATFNSLDNEVSTNDREEESKYRYILRAGDNLYRVAVQVYNDVNQWYLIAELNGWLDANTTASGYPPSAGDIIFLPSDPNELGVSAIPNVVGER